jgi:3D (Asp-Asp-Asp) domain-containing protein
MAYGDNTQYGNFQFNFGNLSPIVEAALERKKKQAQQQQQMSDSIGKLAGSIYNKQQLQNPDANGPGPSDVSTAGYTMSDAVAGSAGSADGDQYRITSYGPESSSPTPADYNETIGARDNQLRPGDVAVSPDLRTRFPLGSHLRIGTTPDVYTVSDFTNPRLHRRVDIYNGQDMGTQPVYGYSQGGVVPLPENAEGVLGWRTWPDFNARRGHETLEQLSNVPAQHFASGGVASFTDPYPEQRRSQYAEHLGPMADVTGIAGVIARQRMFQQEQNQQNISAAMQAANKLMQQRQSDEIANKVLSQLPSYGVNTQGFEGQGQAGLSAVQQLYGLQQNQNAAADKAEDRVNKQYSQGLQDLNREDQYINGGQAPSTPETYTDENGREWRKGEGNHWYPMKPVGAAKQPDEIAQAKRVDRFNKLQIESDAEKQQNIADNKPDVHFSKENEYNALQKRLSPQAGSQTGTAPPIVRQDQLPSPNTAAPEQPKVPAGPAIGTQRKVNGILAEWDGNGWKKVQ